MSAWPSKSAFQLRSSWTYGGRQYTLSADRYRVYVWPGFGSKVSADYGPLVGWSGLPEGLEYHVAFKSNGNFRVSEIWDSQKQLDAFGERLMPVLSDVGIELSGKPEVLEIHSILKR